MNNNSNNAMSRRHFIGLAGSAASMAALAGLGIRSGWANNDPKMDPSSMISSEQSTDVLVIGGGMAGLFAAVKAHDAGARVMMVSKGRLGSSGQTPFAKGIFAFDAEKENMSLDEFTEQVSHSAMGTNNPVYTRQMAEHSMARVRELKEWGFFESPLYNNSFRKPLEERDIPLVERVMITHLIKEKGKIAGAAGFSMDEEGIQIFNAKSVILCTGAGGFKPNGFPICDLTHDGTVMAYQIGARVCGKEWNDGHPGRSSNPAACFDGWGNMFEQTPGVTGVGIRHDLGVDINYQAYVLGNPAVGGPGQGSGPQVEGGPQRPTGMQMSGPGEEGPGGPPPDGGKKGRPQPGKGEGPAAGGAPGGGAPGGGKPGGGKPGEGGAPPGMGGSPVGGSSAGMAIHKAEGLTPINERCESDIPGLYAAGDALGSHMAGGIYTQIGSSLSGSAVQGAIAGENAAAYAAETESTNIPEQKIREIRAEILAPLEREAGYGPAWITQTLQGIMIPNFIIYIKKENLMRAALAYVEELRDHHLPMLRAADLHELRLAHETANMIHSAEMKLRASLMRTESRCSHYRLDFPEVDHENWDAWINIHKGADGQMKLEKQAFGTWPAQRES